MLCFRTEFQCMQAGHRNAWESSKSWMVFLWPQTATCNPTKSCRVFNLKAVLYILYWLSTKRNWVFLGTRSSLEPFWVFLCCNLANPRHVLPALHLSMALAVRKAECGDLHPRPLGLATWQSAKRGDEIEQIGPKIGFNSGQVTSMLLQDTIPTNSNHIQSTDVNVVVCFPLKGPSPVLNQ